MMGDRGIKRALNHALKGVDAYIWANTDHGNRDSRGLSREGYDGGYFDALNDVILALNGVTPPRWKFYGWWADRDATSVNTNSAREAGEDNEKRQ